MKPQETARWRIVRSMAWLIAAGAALLASVAGHAAEHEHAARDHVVIRIADDGPHPSPRLLSPEQAVVWINYSSFPVRVVLPPSASTRMRCREPSHFEVAGDGILRAPLMEPLDAASVCLLGAGTYEYVVEEMDSAARPPRPVEHGRRFVGRIVVDETMTSENGERDLDRLASYHRAWAEVQREIAEARDQLADLLEASGQADAAQQARMRAARARAEIERHEAMAKEFESAIER